ncbi:GntR family transcriptional regulator [Paraburkholderia sp. BL6665CI2N2]|uniref:FadR/GntR family transcriptional regulator n=1 Tax=Paraburkholderia sp. BL6665CI2N2 TaxID=1938806 RepID=UPI001065FEE9|nr:GntR family transcriptional regulator [Paraburkholderia sp. BL6665CI2N2]TDY15824.1 GntR family transcriptional regulator [Paraburkholderia sp. BL6665CI2N2]
MTTASAKPPNPKRPTKGIDVKESAEQDSAVTGQTKFKVARARRTYEDICLQIRLEVSEGRLKPGDRLPPERNLAEQFGVSRTAVRDALRTLEVAGVVACERGVNGGAFIRHGDPGIITQAVQDMVLLGRVTTDSIIEARILLMNDALRLACKRATHVDLDAIERDIDSIEQLTLSGDLTRRSTHLVDFYSLIAQATHNEVIVMLVDSLSEIFRQLLIRLGPAPRSDLVSVRRLILRHLRARDTDSAIEEMTRHLERLSRDLLSKEKNLGRKTSSPHTTR